MNVGRRNNAWSGILEPDTLVGCGMCAFIFGLAAAICTGATVGLSIGENSVIHATYGGCAVLHGLAAATGVAAAIGGNFLIFFVDDDSVAPMRFSIMVDVAEEISCMSSLVTNISMAPLTV
jgi:hypothetical protein